MFYLLYPCVVCCHDTGEAARLFIEEVLLL